MADKDGSIDLDWNVTDTVTPDKGLPDAVYDVSVDVVAVLGVAKLRVSQILKLGRGAVVELERQVNEPIEIRANGHLVARGEVVIVDDNLAVKLTEVMFGENANN